MSEQPNIHVRTDVARRASRRTRRLALAAACTLAIGTVACGSDSKPSTAPSTAPSITEAPAPAATEPPLTTTTEAVTTTAAATTTTEAATTTAAPRTAVAKGTLADIPEALKPGPPTADGWVTITGETAWDGDLTGTEAYTEAFSPADPAGAITAHADVTFTGTLTGVGDGSFGWHEGDHPADGGLQGAAQVVGVSGVFEGATGTLSWTFTDDSNGTYEVHLVWA